MFSISLIKIDVNIRNLMIGQLVSSLISLISSNKTEEFLDENSNIRYFKCKNIILFF